MQEAKSNQPHKSGGPSPTVMLLLALSAVGVIVWIYSQGGVIATIRAVGNDFGPSCTIGVTGTAASVTFKGWGATASCDAQLSSKQAYRYDGPARVEPIVCQYTLAGERVTVRDSGTLKLVGNALCNSFQQQGGN